MLELMHHPRDLADQTIGPVCRTSPVANESGFGQLGVAELAACAPDPSPVGRVTESTPNIAVPAGKFREPSAVAELASPKTTSSDWIGAGFNWSSSRAMSAFNIGVVRMLPPCDNQRIQGADRRGSGAETSALDSVAGRIGRWPVPPA